MDTYNQALSEAARSIHQDGRTPHGSRGMGGVTKHYGLASSKQGGRTRSSGPEGKDGVLCVTRSRG